MSAITEAKELSEIIRKTGNIDLERRILSLHGEIIELSDKNRDLQEQVRELEDKLQTQASLTFDPPYYRKAGDPVPFCQTCWERDRKAIHLQGPTPDQYHLYSCQVCNGEFGPTGITMGVFG